MYVRMYACMYACMLVCMHVCMLACISLSIYIHRYIHIYVCRVVYSFVSAVLNIDSTIEVSKPYVFIVERFWLLEGEGLRASRLRGFVLYR